jgi:hypothetical protein
MRLRVSIIAFALTVAVCITPVWADTFFFSTGNPDSKLGSLSRQASTGKVETETADDFVLTQTTVINQATITGLVVPTGTPLTSISNVEVELYHVFPLDSANPPSGVVPTRVNSPADVEIASATRDGSAGTLSFISNVLTTPFSVPNSMVNGINKVPNQTTGGEGPVTGEEVQTTITFTPPILLPAGHYFFRPEVLVTGGDFLYLSAPKPIVSPPGTVFAGDLQAWTRNSSLNPNWLRIGTDIVGGATPPTFNMTFSLSGDTIPNAGTPGEGKCFKDTVSAVADQFGSLKAASRTLGYPSKGALKGALRQLCEP